MSRPMSPETRAKISAAKLGKPGHKHKPEVLARISAALTGREFSEEHCANLSKAHVGRPHTAEAKAKISAALTGKKPTAETRDKLSKAKRGKKLSPQHRLAIARGLAAWNTGKKRVASPKMQAVLAENRSKQWRVPKGFERFNAKLMEAGFPLAERRAAVDAAARQSSLHRSP